MIQEIEVCLQYLDDSLQSKHVFRIARVKFGDLWNSVKTLPKNNHSCIMMKHLKFHYQKF